MTRQELLFGAAEALFSYRCALETVLYKRYKPGDLSRETDRLKDLERGLQRLAEEIE